MNVLLAHFGEQCDVRELTPDDLASYATARRAGTVKVSEKWTTRAVGPRSVVADLAVLNSMLNWARTARVNGTRLLDSNPLTGIARVHRDSHPRRPVATYDRFTATREALRSRGEAAGDTVVGRRWIRVELALVLAEATGRRLSAIRDLRWEDIDWDRKTIRWRAEADKRRKEWTVPATDSLLAELRAGRRQLGAVGGWICTDEVETPKPLDRHTLARLLSTAEADAGLPKLDGSLWHAYRRKWATERKHLPLTDVAAAGGWQNTATLLTCYQAPTNDQLLAVMSEERKVRDVVLVSSVSGETGKETGKETMVGKDPTIRRGRSGRT